MWQTCGRQYGHRQMLSLTCWKKFWMGTLVHQHTPSSLMSLCGHLPNWFLQLNALAADECLLVAEVWRCVVHDCFSSLPQTMNDILHKEVVPSSWRKTLFQMFPKSAHCKPTRTIQSLNIWCLVGWRRRWSNTGFHNTWCGHCVWCSGNRKAKSSLNRMPVENLTSKLGCGKVAFSAPRTLFICIGSCIEEIWTNGAKNCKMVVWTSATAVSHCWIYDLLMTFCCLLHLPMKQPEWWMPW